MDVSVNESQQITKLLDEWYIKIRARHVTKAKNLKIEIEKTLPNIEQDQSLFLYYLLINFRYEYLLDSLSISQESFSKIDAIDEPTDELLSYYYHFFKAIHSNITGSHTLARKHYEKAELLLENMQDEIEKAEFYYEFAIFYCHTQKPIDTIHYLQKSKEIFSSHETEYEVKIAFCHNLYGLAYTHLKEFELAEEHYLTALELFKKEDEEYFSLIVRHNLGYMYASQNLSSLALRHLSEVTQKMPNNYKAMFIQAREYSKLGEIQRANELIEKGIQICRELNNEGYIHHFIILKHINNNSPTSELEEVVNAGFSYFEREELHEYTHEYNEILALKFYQEDNHSKASKHFFVSSQARKKLFERGALK